MAALFLAAVTSFAQVDPDRLVLTVNGEEIRGTEYYRRMEYLPGVGKPTGRTFSELPPGLLTMDQLITERLVFQLAKQKGVLPTDLEVDAELKVRQQENPNLVTNWTASGRTMDELRYQVRFELAQFKIQTFGVTITNQEVDNHYKTSAAIYTEPKKAKLRVIVVQSEGDRDTVDAALKSGTSFAAAATKYSADVTKANGGEYGTVPYAFLNTQVRDAVQAIKIGESTTWLSVAGSDKPTFMKFMLEDVIPETKLPLDDNLRRSIRRRLMMDRGTVKNDIQKEMIAMRQSAKIDIKQKEFADAYQKFIQAYLKQGG